ncbi:MAG: hypothetical protein P8L79_06050 [Rhodospirillaceae bacterium]|nr:hypothetical protein [Rhodospirillaceae bacterium]
MNRTLLIIAAFSFGYVLNDLTEGSVKIIPELNAEVAGMSHYDLRRDRGFKKAVQNVISGNCYVDDDYIYC